jgi:hypothetical protein
MLPPSGTWRRPIRCGSSAPPSAARSARCASAGASLQRSTAAPEAWHRSGPLARSGTPRWRAREEATTHSPHHSTGCAAHPPRLLLPPGHGLATTRYASEPIDITADERNRERGRPSVYCRCACCLSPDSGSGSKETLPHLHQAKLVCLIE